MAIALHTHSGTPTVDTTNAIDHAMRLYRGIMGVFLAGVVALTLFLAAFSIAAPKNSFGPTIFGRQLLVVRSGSMHPTFATGSIIGVKTISQAKANKMQVGTIVVFRSAANNDILITHRIISRLTPITRYTREGSAQFVTKGDANAAEDGTILSASRIVGEYSFSVPRAGYILTAIQQGRLLTSALVAFIFASIAVMLSHWALESTEQKENQ